MSRVICDLPNASLEISGVRFQKLEDGRFISDEIGDEATAVFLSIPGYVLDEDEHEDDEEPPVTAPVKTKAQLTAEKKAADKKAAADKKTEAVAPAVVTPAVVIPAVTDPVTPVVPETPAADLAGVDADVDLDSDKPAGDTDPVNPEDVPPTDVF